MRKYKSNAPQLNQNLVN